MKRIPLSLLGICTLVLTLVFGLAGQAWGAATVIG